MSDEELLDRQTNLTHLGQKNLEPGGVTRSGKVRVCEARPLDPLPPPVHGFMKNIPPPVRNAVRHVSNY